MNLKNYIETYEGFPEDGIKYRDISPLLENPKAFNETVDRMSETLEDEGIDRIAGFDARGFIFGPSVAQEMEKPFLMIRKEGKLPGETISQDYGLEYGEDILEIQRDGLDQDENIALIDDLLASGGTMKAGAELVEQAGAEPAYGVALVELDYLEGRKTVEDYGLEFESILRYGENK